jgi:hypothetical protein
MRGKGNQNQVEEEYEEDEFGSRKDGPSSSFTVNNNNSSKGLFFFTFIVLVLDPALFTLLFYKVVTIDVHSFLYGLILHFFFEI